jgi:hypothetical protein
VIIDCERCEVRDIACGDCVVGVLLGMPGVPSRDVPVTAVVSGPSGAAEVQLDAAERRALEVLADQGLIPRLRLVRGVPRPAPGRSAVPHDVREVG